MVWGGELGVLEERDKNTTHKNVLTCERMGKAFFLPKSKSLGSKCTSSGSGKPPAFAHARARPSNDTKRSPLMLKIWRAALGLPRQATKASARSATWPSCVT